MIFMIEKTIEHCFFLVAKVLVEVIMKIILCFQKDKKDAKKEKKSKKNKETVNGNDMSTTMEVKEEEPDVKETQDVEKNGKELTPEEEKGAFEKFNISEQTLKKLAGIILH